MMGDRKKLLDTPAKVALFVATWNAAACPQDVGRLLGMTVEQVYNAREWCRRRQLKVKRFRMPDRNPKRTVHEQVVG